MKAPLGLQVVAGSAAAVAGLVAGNTVVTIDSVPAGAAVACGAKPLANYHPAATHMQLFEVTPRLLVRARGGWLDVGSTKPGDFRQPPDGAVPAQLAIRSRVILILLPSASLSCGMLRPKHRGCQQFEIGSNGRRHISRAPVGTTRSWLVRGPVTFKQVDLVAAADDYLTFNLSSPKSPFYPPPPPSDNAEVHRRLLPATPGSPMKVGYIGIGDEDIGSGSYKAMAKELAGALAELTAAGMDALVLDIRGNDGGEDDQAPAVLDFFVPPGSPRVLYELASYSNRLLSVANKGKLRPFMNGTDLNGWGVIGNASGGADGTLYYGPLDVAKYKGLVPGFEGPWLGPLVCMINAYCDSTCEGIAMGIAALDKKRAAVTGWETTLGSFGMSGGTVVLPGDVTFEVPFGRSLDKDSRIQIDSDWTLAGGIAPTVLLPRTRENIVAFHESGAGDVELAFAVETLDHMTRAMVVEKNSG